MIPDSKVTLKNVFEILTDSYSPAIILPDSDMKIHYSTLRNVCQQLQSTHPFNNLQKGDIVLISLPNSVEFIAVLFVLLSVQAVVHPVKLSDTDAELSTDIPKLSPKLIISSKSAQNYQTVLEYAKKKSIPFYSVGLELIPQLFSLTRIVRKLNITATHNTKTVTPALTLTHVAGPKLSPPPSTKKVSGRLYSKNDLAVILSTHGTTGPTKLVPLTHGNILSSIYNLSRSFGLSASDSSYLIMPMYHSHGLIGVMFSSFFAGSTVLVKKEMSIKTFWNDIKNYRVTWFSAVPLYHKMLLALPKTGVRENHSLRFVQSCGSRIEPELLLELERFLDVPIINSFVMTEAGFLVTSALPAGKRKPGSVGVPIGNSVVMIDENGQKVSGVGEICIHGLNVFDGYWMEKPGDSFIELDGKRYFKTGDLGWFDERGHLVFVGRKLDNIIIDGQIVSPALMDQVLMKHPGVLAGVFFGVLNSKGEHDVHAAVVVRENQLVTEKSLKQWLVSFVPSKVPITIHIVPSIPQTSMGKIQRQKAHLLFKSKTKL